MGTDFTDIIQYIVSTKKHPLHRYINFDNGLPGHIFRCTCGLEEPNADDYDALLDLGWEDTARGFLLDTCPALASELVVYGLIGHGTFGVILAARSREKVEGSHKHYAIKVQPYIGGKKSYSDVSKIYAPRVRVAGRTHHEALKLHFLEGNERVSQLHSAYLHGEYAYIVMDRYSVDFDPRWDILPQLQDIDGAPRVPGFNGTGLIQDKKPRLGEEQVRKVISHILEALMFLNDRTFAHQDMSHRNYLVDENLNAQLIDFESVKMRNLRGSYRASELGHIYAIEHMMSPELALALIAYLEHDDPTRNDDDQKQVPFPRDLRDLQLWNLAVIAYELLHGYSPWEDPEMIVFDINYHPAGMDDMDVDIHKDIRSERRERIINEPIPISDELGLSQDCVDYLTAAFHKDPEQRPKVEDLAAFPWFSGAYLDSGADFTRPPRLTDE